MLDAGQLKLGQWIADYYCAPLGETLRSMTPLSGEMRRGTIYSLTPTGRDIARQLHLGTASDVALGTSMEDEKTQILRMLDARPLAGSYLKSKFPKSAAILKALEKSELIVAEDVAAERDPLRASAERLRAEFLARPDSASLGNPGRKPGDVELPRSPHQCKTSGSRSASCCLTWSCILDRTTWRRTEECSSRRPAFRRER